jgi:quercetin dioxygenase-like cupin family protein
MITLVALFRFIAMEGKPRKQKKKSQLKKGRTMNPLTQFRKIHILPLLIAPALVAIVTFTPGPARATSPCGFTGTNLLFPVPFGYFPSGSLNLMCNEFDLYGWNIKATVKGDSDLYVTLNTWQAGGRTGWHTHPGPSLVTVIEGTITVYDSSDSTCTPKTYTAGQTFTDIGCGDIHNVVNNTSAAAQAVAVQIVPHGQMRRQDRPQPANCPALTCPQ